MLHLSSIYNSGLMVYGIVYHTQPNSDEVEFVANKFFPTAGQASKWFHKKHKAKHFVQPEIVELNLTCKSIETYSFFYEPEDKDND